MKNIKSKPLSKGYQIKKVVTSTPGKSVTKKLNKNHYPNGIVCFILLALFYVIFLSTVLGIGFSDKLLGHQWWLNGVLGAGVGYFGFNLLWFIGRTGLFEMAGYGFTKFLRMIHLDTVREKIEFYVHEPAVNDVNNVSEYKQYCVDRRTYTRRWFYISLAVSTVVFVITLILYFTLFYSL